jgi:sodium-dependent dicarboxylate transporter 2/3/5
LAATTLLGLSAFYILSRSLREVQFTERQQQETEEHLSEEWSRLGAMTAVQKRVAVIFTTTALLWILRPYLGGLSAHIHWSDTGISLLAAVLLFSSTAGGKSLVDWESTSKLPWGILILFGGGLALAGTLQQSYWFEALELGMKSFENTPVLLWVIIMALLGVFATELLSNMALVSALMPLVLSLSQTFGWSMEILSVPLVLGASCAFMLPMATPPNAIVFSTGKLTVSYMMARGIVLNILSVIILVALGMTLLTMG